MKTVKEVQKAFREARIAGEKMLEAGRITWDAFAATMVMYELKLKSMGEII